MKLRKICVSVLVLLLMISSLQLTAFADDEQLTGGQATGEAEKMSNLIFMAMPENMACTELESLKDVKAKLVVTKDADPSISAELPLTYEKEVGGFIGEAYVEGDAMKTIIADLTANQEKYSDLLDLDDLNLEELLGEGEDLTDEDGKLSKKKLAKTLSETLIDEIEAFDIFDGYTVAVEGLPEHYTVQHTGVVVTGEMLLDVFEMIVKLMSELLEIPELENAQTMQEVLDGLAEAMEYESLEKMLADFELTEEEIAQLNTAVAEVEKIFDQARAGTFESVLTDIAMLKCDCIVPTSYEIYHEYYKEVNGERTLVARIPEGEVDEYGSYYLIGETGSYIMAEDYVKCEFDGKVYDYVGSWDSWTIYDEKVNWDESAMISEFKLGDFICDGLCLRYVYVEETAAPEPAPPTDVDTDDADEEEDAPLTGDHTPIGVYLALFATSILALIALLVILKKKQK